MIMALVLLNLVGGDCVDDVRLLEGGEGFCRLYREVEWYGRSGSERRALRGWWRTHRTRTFPSPTGVREYLERFHDPEQEGCRQPHTAFIPRPSTPLRGLVRRNGGVAAAVQRRSPQKTATLDMDATLVPHPRVSAARRQLHLCIDVEQPIEGPYRYPGKTRPWILVAIPP
ncbi:MAG: hypothetical protein LDL33_10400 [Desulfomonile sp.]|nr:hypothetical protein [Desulfomonile sp.]